MDFRNGKNLILFYFNQYNAQGMVISHFTCPVLGIEVRIQIPRISLTSEKITL